MNKEEILAKSRQENKERDLYQQEIDYKAANYALVVIIIFITILLLLHAFAGNGFRVELYAPVAIFNTVLYMYRYIKASERKTFDLLVLLCWGIAAILTAIASILNIYTI